MEIAEVKESKQENDYKAEMDAKTLMEAEHIKKDKPRCAAAMACLGKQKEHISSIEDLHKAADDHFAEKRKEKMPKEMMKE